jgi:hypothetical protein
MAEMVRGPGFLGLGDLVVGYVGGKYLDLLPTGHPEQGVALELFVHDHPAPRSRRPSPKR